MTLIETDTHLDRVEPGEYLVFPGVRFTVVDYGTMTMNSTWNPDGYPDGTRLFLFSMGEPENHD